MPSNPDGMPLIQKIASLPKAWRELGPNTLWLYAKYQLKLRSGWLRLTTSAGGAQIPTELQPTAVMEPVGEKELENVLGSRTQEILTQANEILQGSVRLFGAEPRELELDPIAKPKHWTAYHSHMPDGSDIRPIWEAGRFSWATTLARAYWIFRNENYAEGFWKCFENFSTANPPNLGPNWSSAQEVALRLISLAFCYSLLANSAASTQTRRKALAAAAIVHAQRIIPTLDYAKAQNNNHLLSEALGLVTAATLVPTHEKADEWKNLGWRLFNDGVQAQIHGDGAYAQHSNNYHRVLLQLGLWAYVLADHLEQPLPADTLDLLGKATHWLLKLLELENGRVPNLGPNDGAYVLPLSILPFDDFRPALQASSIAFASGPAMDAGIWNEMALWLGMQSPTQRSQIRRKAPHVRGEKKSSSIEGPIRVEGKNSWAYLRAAEFKERPGHADQLHVDLWWRGLNIAQDAGSYLYTAPAPWDNAFASARVHNSITIKGQEPMTRVGRFLWLDWAQAKVNSTERGRDGRLVAAAVQHDGYAKFGLTHEREVSWNYGRWVVTDHLIPADETEKTFQARLHWLLPDWDWQCDVEEVRIESPFGEIEIAVDVSVGDLTEMRVYRAGELVHGSGLADPILGWASPTYGVKLPALSFIADAQGSLPITITTTWNFPK